MDFWTKLRRPIFALAPMANVTDAAFRRIIAKYGRPSVMFTEFVSVEGLLSAGRGKLLVDFMYSEFERPIVAQIFGGKPEQFTKVAKLISELGFDGIDINMGCPDSGVEKSGGGAALIKNPKLAQEIIKATQAGAPNLPLSVKTRLGYNKNEIETWLPALLETELAAITIHLRTRKEMSFVPAHWEEMEKIVDLRDKMFGSPSTSSGRLKERTLLIGNGDVENLEQAREKIDQYSCDGVMIGRGIFGNPWLFAGLQHSHILKNVRMLYVPTVEEKLRVCLEHTKLFEELYGPPSAGGFIPPFLKEVPRISPFVKGVPERQGIFRGGGFLPKSLPRDGVLPLKKGEGRLKPFDIMKKHYKAYINGFPACRQAGMSAKELRGKLMSAKNVDEVEGLISDFLK